jgi:hypothetical protein
MRIVLLGTESPYPTVVTVTIAHQKVAAIDWYGESLSHIKISVRCQRQQKEYIYPSGLIQVVFASSKYDIVCSA